MLWEHYVFRRGPEVQETWDQMFRKKRTRLLYVTGRGFDIRGQAAMFSFVDINDRISMVTLCGDIAQARLLEEPTQQGWRPL